VTSHRGRHTGKKCNILLLEPCRRRRDFHRPWRGKCPAIDWHRCRGIVRLERVGAGWATSDSPRGCRTHTL